MVRRIARLSAPVAPVVRSDVHLASDDGLDPPLSCRIVKGDG